MRGIATKELKNRLSFYLRLVRSGASFVVTDRGRPVAQLGPLAEQNGARDEERAWLDAAAKGQVSLPRGKGFAKFRPIKMRNGKKLSDIVIEDRR